MLRTTFSSSSTCSMCKELLESVALHREVTGVNYEEKKSINVLHSLLTNFQIIRYKRVGKCTGLNGEWAWEVKWSRCHSVSYMRNLANFHANRMFRDNPRDQTSNKGNSRCEAMSGVKADVDCFHTRAKCVIWIIIWIAHFELCSVHMREVIAIFELCSVHTREVIAIFELCSVHTRDRIWDLAFQSGRRMSGYPANQTCTELAFHFLCFYTYAARGI